MRPASLLTPETAEVISYSVIRCFRQASLFTLTELVVALGNLPDWATLSAVSFKNLRKAVFTMCIDRHRLPPAKTH